MEVGGGEVYFKFLRVYHAEIISHLQMLTNNQSDRILVLSSAIEKKNLRKDLSFMAKERKRKEERKGSWEYKGN